MSSPARDPVMAQRLASGDTQRIVRALEVLDATGMSLASGRGCRGSRCWISAPRSRFVVAVERDELARRIDARFRDDGADGRARRGAATRSARARSSLAVHDRARSPPAARVTSPARCLSRRQSRLGKCETRQYAKRQVTWARSNMIAWTSVSAQEMQQLAVDFVIFYSARSLTLQYLGLRFRANGRSPRCCRGGR